MYDVELVKVEPLNDKIISFSFQKPPGFHYIAGQFIELILFHKEPDDRGIKRWFTLSSSPSEELLTITTKFSTQNSSSLKSALWLLNIGQTVKLTDAMGDFVLPKNNLRPLLMVAGGIGITPVHSMLRWTVSQNEKRTIDVMYGVHSENEIVFEKEIRSAANLEIVVSDPVNWRGKTGILNSPMVFPSIKKEHLVYLSGPETMIEQLFYDLKLAGVPPENLVTDFFPGYKEI
ncbi:MAG: FAD-dependent oxidoreductase [Patescibacteria group bacterium]